MPLTLCALPSLSLPYVRRDRLYQAGAKPKADMAKLNEALLKLVDKLRPTPEEIQRQQAAFERAFSLLLLLLPAIPTSRCDIMIKGSACAVCSFITQSCCGYWCCSR